MNFLSHEFFLRSLSRERRYGDRLNPTEVYEANEFKKLFRFSKENVLDLVNRLEEKLDHNGNRNCLNPLQKVFIGLRFYATGEMQLSLAAWININHRVGTVSYTHLTLPTILLV